MQEEIEIEDVEVEHIPALLRNLLFTELVADLRAVKKRFKRFLTIWNFVLNFGGKI
jgi:hypothetical protein